MKIFKKYFELTTWISALVLLGLMNPQANSHFSFCLFKFLGARYCPGCGLGHSISYLFHGNLQASFNAHPLGVFAVAVIATRIYTLSSLHLFPHIKQHNYGNQY